MVPSLLPVFNFPDLCFEISKLSCLLSLTDTLNRVVICKTMKPLPYSNLLDKTPNSSKFCSKLTQMGFSVGNAVSSAVEKQLSAYLPASKDDATSASTTTAFETSASDEADVPATKSVSAKFFTKAR